MPSLKTILWPKMVKIAKKNDSKRNEKFSKIKVQNKKKITKTREREREKEFKEKILYMFLVLI